MNIADRPDDRGDISDIAFLIRRLGLASPDQVMSIVARYYPEDRVPARTRFLIEDIFSELESG